MRTELRIPIIMKKLENGENITKLLEFWFKPETGVQLEIGMPYFEIPTIAKRIKSNLPMLKLHWESSPDLRIGQLFIRCNMMEKYVGNYYYIEDEISVIKSGILEPRDIIAWGQSFDKDGNRLVRTEFKLLKNLGTSHIKSILKDFKDKKFNIQASTYSYLLKELKSRD